MDEKSYIIQCHVKKVKLGDKGITSLTIRPTGKSRIEGMDDKCLGWEPEQDGANPQDVPAAEDSQPKLFSIDIKINELISGNLVQGLLVAKFHGGEIKIEIKVETDNQNNKIIKICGVTLL